MLVDCRQHSPLIKDEDLQMPIGFHARSYAFNQNGHSVTDAHYTKNANEPFGKLLDFDLICCILEEHDIMGVYMHLEHEKPRFLRSTKEDNDLEPSDGSFIKLYKNGVEQACFFNNIYEGSYYAAISLYMNAQC